MTTCLEAEAPSLTGADHEPHIGPRRGLGGLGLNVEQPNGEIHVAPSPAGHNPGRDYVEAWLSLARREWRSLVVIPADGDGSTAEIASTLAEIGQRLSYGTVTAIAVSSLEYGSALALTDLQQHVKREQRNRAYVSPAEPRPAPEAAADEPTPAGGQRAGPDESERTPGKGIHREPQVVNADGSPGEALLVVPPARLIISVPPVITQPLSLAAAEEADVVIVTVRLRHSRLAELRRTIELIGRERISGCLLVS